MRKLFFLVFLGMFAIACSDDSEETKNDQGNPQEDAMVYADGASEGDAGVDAAAGDVGEAGAAFSELSAYSSVEGTHTIKVEASEATTKVELLVNGEVGAMSETAPFDLEWDTTTAEDGLAQISLKAYGPAGDVTGEETPVVVLNNGEVPTLKYASDGTGTMDVPDPLGTVDLHEKHHWDMPADIVKVLAILTWDNPDFNFDLALGTGTCPHSGEEAAREAGDTPPVVTEYANPGGDPIPEGVQWFAHIGCTNEAEMAGQSANYEVKIYLFK